MNLIDELEEFYLAINCSYKKDYCFYVGRLYREQAIEIKQYEEYEVIFHPLMEDEAIIFAPKQNWN